MLEEMTENTFKSAVGTSTKKNAYESGKEVAETTLKRLGCKPDFFLLFSTIHYESEGGFQEFLNGVREVLPEETPLVGGTVVGFLNSDGCYARGATSLAVSYKNMNVVVGLGKNTKRSPKKASRQCANSIKNGLKNQYPNKFLFSIISGITFPKTFQARESNIIKSKILAKAVMPALKLSQKIFQKGFGNEEMILEELTKILPEFMVLRDSSFDDNKGLSNYQFFNKNVFTNSIVCLGLETDLGFNLDFATGAEKTNIEFRVTKVSKDKIVIKKINNKPAVQEFLSLMNFSSGLLEYKWAPITMKYPLGFCKNNKIFLRPVVMAMGDYIGLGSTFENENGFVASMSQPKMIEAIDELLKSKKPEFGIFVSCTFRQSFLGYKIYEVQEKLKRYFQDKPFVVVYSPGEGIYKPDEGLCNLAETITSAIFEGR